MQLGSLHSFGTKLQCKYHTQWPIAGLWIGNNIESVLNFYFPVLANESTTLKLHKEIERESERERMQEREKVTKSPKRLNSIVIIYLISLDKHGSFWLESFIYLINNDFVQCQASFTLVCRNCFSDFSQKYQCLSLPRGREVMFTALACCAGGLGSAPAIGKPKRAKRIRWF